MSRQTSVIYDTIRLLVTMLCMLFSFGAYRSFIEGYWFVFAGMLIGAAVFIEWRINLGPRP